MRRNGEGVAGREDGDERRLFKLERRHGRRRYGPRFRVGRVAVLAAGVPAQGMDIGNGGEGRQVGGAGRGGSREVAVAPDFVGLADFARAQREVDGVGEGQGGG